MITALVWNDAKSFQRHLEHMRVFRQSHHSHPEDELALLKDMPAQADTRPLSKKETARIFISMRRKSVVVPIWQIALPRNSQN